MNKALIRITVCLILSICFVCALPIAAGARPPYYKIPSRDNFNPNSAANEIESIVNRKSIIEGSVVDGKIHIDGEAAAQKNAEALAEISGYVKKLNDRKMYLNRELINVVTVRVKAVDLSDFVEIIIDPVNLGKITELNTLKIVLQNNNKYIALDKACINFIANNYGAFRLQIRELSDTYAVRFLSGDDNIIEKYGVDIKIGIPSSSREQTVYLFANNQQENWGGQYNASARSIDFMTKYSGEYNVASPKIVINDIDGLTEYEQQAIRFMVVRGYFELKNKKFNPQSTLTRYSFAESLVRMFFALDNDAVCTFPDVDKSHYRYVAASEQSNIVEGFDDGTFRGRQAVTVEQVLALTARTIHQKNGYVYPEQVSKYLHFTDDNVIGDWARKEVAMAVREGIYSGEMNLKFSENITRKDAAVILYRLFMIMNNTPEPTDNVDYNAGLNWHRETFWSKKNAIITAAAAASVNIAALTAALLFIKKRRRKSDS